MSARRILLQAALVAVAASPVIAQDAPEGAGAVPRQAVERTRARGDDGGSHEARAPERREPVTRASSPAVRSRPREVAPMAAAPALEQQGGRRNPSAGSGGGNRGGGAGSRGNGGSRAAGGGSRGGSREADGGNRGDQGVARPRGGVRNPDAAGGRSAARAVPRGSAPPRSQGWGNNVGRRYYAGPSGLGYYFYDPWSWYGWGWPAYGAYGNWAGYYGNAWGGYGNAWGGVGNGWGGGPWGGGYGLYTGPTGWSIGSVRLKVAERDAEVYVDGYYAGVVDDFDGIWQKLRLDDGGYRLEIRKPGFETLVVDLRVQPGRTITYRGTMHPVP